MTRDISLNSAQFLQLEPNIRVSSTSTFNSQEAYENTFEDVMLEQANKIEEEKKPMQINFSNLGPPAGFFLDVSLLSEQDKLEISSMCSTY